jgi:hypothetical protein
MRTKTSHFLFKLILIGPLLYSCANLKNTRKGFINHPAMSLEKRQTPQINQNINRLCANGSFSSGGCTTCAK